MSVSFLASKRVPLHSQGSGSVLRVIKNINTEYTLHTLQNGSFLFNLPSFTPPVRATVGEVRYSIEIDVGGGVKGQFYKTRF